MIVKTILNTTSTPSQRQIADLIEDFAVEAIVALFPVFVIVSIFLVGAPCGWAWGAAAGAGLWALIGAIIAVCASLVSSRADESF